MPYPTSGVHSPFAFTPKQMLKIPKIISAIRLFIFSFLQNLRNIKFWKWPKTKPSQQYLRQLPAELIDESLRFLPYKKCSELSKSSRSYYLANLAKYRGKRFPRKLKNKLAQLKFTWMERLFRSMGMVTLKEHELVRREIDRMISALRKHGQIPPTGEFT